MTSLGNQINRIVASNDREPKVGELGENAFIMLEEYLSTDAMIEISDYVHRVGYGAQFATSAEVPILREFHEQLYKDLVKAGLVESDSKSATYKVCPGARVLMTLKQFVGPLDQQIIHSSQIINESWLQQKLERLTKLSTDLENTTPVALRGDSLLQQAQSLKSQALECLHRLDLGTFCSVRTEKRRAVNEDLPSDARFKYTAELLQLLGDNLVAVIAYGGSITAPDPCGIKDFDNFVVVHDTASAYDILRTNQISYLDKPVHLQLIPQHLLQRYLLMSYSGPHTLKVVHGEAEIPVLDQSQEISIRMTDLTVTVFNKRRSLLSTFIANPQMFIDKVKADHRSLALVAAHTVIPLAHIGWFRQYVNDPREPRVGKREAAKAALESCGLHGLPEAFLDPQKFLELSPDELQRELADSINNTSRAITWLYNWLKNRDDDFCSASLF